MEAHYAPSVSLQGLQIALGLGVFEEAEGIRFSGDLQIVHIVCSQQ
jgi:hypothetical protein